MMLAFTLQALRAATPEQTVTLRTHASAPRVAPAQSAAPAGLWSNYDHEQYLGIRLGLNIPNLFFRGMGGIDTETMAGLKLGVVYGIQLTGELPLFFETGLNYAEKGARVEAGETTQQIDYKMRYLEVPLVVKYKLDLGVDDFTVQPFFGGFVGLGIAGKTSYFEDREKLSTFRSNLYHNFDCGFRMGCGMAYRNFYLEMSYDLGMTNVAHSDFRDLGYDDFDDHIRTGNLSITLGLDF